MTWWSFDIECANWDQVILGAALSDDGRHARFGGHPVNPTRTAQEIAEWYRSLPQSDIVWAHNGGGYDFLLLISATPDLTWQARMAGGAIVSCRAKGCAECRDTMRLFPGTLARWTRRKSDTGLTCRCGAGCGGYCSIRIGMSRPEICNLASYCDDDCRALLDTLREDLERLAAEGLSILGSKGTPRLTFGAVSWHTASQMAGIDPQEVTIDWGEYDSGRRAYYGGRCEVGRTEAPSGHRYDVNSMYPWALTSPVPVGARLNLFHGEPSKAYDAENPGAYHAIVLVPETDLPPLPHRYPEPKSKGRLTPERLLWSTGTLEGWWTHLELQAAERHGAKIDRITSAVVWNGYEPIYQPYVEHVYRHRNEARANGDDRWAGILKWYANALSGKLAQHPESAQVKVVGDDEPEPLGWHYVGGRVWSKPMRRLAANCRPIQAAYLTSRARIALLDRLARHHGRWLYCDTDSSYLIDADAQGVHESALGAWQYEGELSDWLCLAPKLYRYRDETGAPRVRARGIPRPEWSTLDTLRAGETIHREIGVERLKSGGGAFKRRALTRTHHDWNTGRCGTRFVLPDGTTRPLHREPDGTYR